MSLAVDFIKEAEGLRLEAYQDSAGVWTIGYGHTGNDVKRGMAIEAERAEVLLARDIAWAVDEVDHSVTVPLTTEQDAALVSLVFNIGSGAFRSSTVLRRLNAGDYEGAAEAILMWNKITRGGKKVVSKGLVNRRERERALFISCAPTVAPPRTSVTQSTTIQASGTQIAAGPGVVGTAVVELEGLAQYMVIGGALLIMLLGMWIMRERLRKWAGGDR